MNIQELPTSGWRKVVRVTDRNAGLDAIISVHDVTLGPAVGGCRIFPYATFEDALEDVKRLSRGMTYKNALGGIPFGGGKSVIIADPRKDKSPEMFEAFGRALNELNGLYYTAEDSGITEGDLEIVRGVSKWVGGVEARGKGGNPSPYTARGVWRGIEASAMHQFGAPKLEGLRVAILGVGAVGMSLAERLHDAGVKLTVADVNKDAVAEAMKRFDARAVAPDDCVAADVDIYAPCALGGAINVNSVGRLRARVVAGAANNQLATPDMDEALRKMGVLYAPDYVINAAGVISVGLEILGEWDKPKLEKRIDGIAGTLTRIFDRAASENRPTGAIADEMALEVIARAKKAA
jgi:leucine dehydrogenase